MKKVIKRTKQSFENRDEQFRRLPLRRYSGSYIEEDYNRALDNIEIRFGALCRRVSRLALKKNREVRDVRGSIIEDEMAVVNSHYS